MGLLTFLLPCLSAVLKHFGVDFSGGDGGYMTVVRWVFDQVSPAILTAILGVVTLVAFLMTRPSARDVFFDIETVGPAEKLAGVRDLMAIRPGSGAAGIGGVVGGIPGLRDGDYVEESRWVELG